MSLRIRTLRLVGIDHNYEVDFLRNDEVQSLSVITGEISTGKTSILEFVDFCLGSSSHPKHLEIQRRVRSSLLEIELNDEILVIERPVFGDSSYASVHRCALGQLSETHTTEKRPLAPVGSLDSLSSMLLGASDMQGLRLKEAPTQQASSTDPLSFRDLMPLCFLTNQRMDNKNLLLEANFMRALKLRQVIEVVFGVFDGQLAAMQEQLNDVIEERRELEKEIAALDTFLRENAVPDRASLDEERVALLKEFRQGKINLAELDSRMRATTTYAANERHRYGELRQASGHLAARVRDRETLLQRLLPLRGQYAEDDRKLTFFEEAARIFDPLRVQTCPACAQPLDEPVSIEPGGTCSLCDKTVPSSESSIDVTSEQLAVRARLRAIDEYIQEVEDQLLNLKDEYGMALEEESSVQQQLDSLVAQELSPFTAERDTLVRSQEEKIAGVKRVDQQLAWRDGLDRRSMDEGKLKQRISDLRKRIDDVESKQFDRARIVAELSERFHKLLVEFGYPKVEEPEPPFIDDNFVPHVRGNRYAEVGSTGALTLTALAWQLSIFELAVDLGQPHPGFLMIDSPQKNLMPEDNVAESEFADPAIPRRVWEHLIARAENTAGAAQVIVVDNRPPDSASSYIQQRFSGRTDDPPYGLIFDEIG